MIQEKSQRMHLMCTHYMCAFFETALPLVAIATLAPKLDCTH